MPRQARHAPGGIIYHVLNRAAGRRELFGKRGDDAALARLFHDAVEDSGMRACGFCLMPNHWHVLLWPRVDGKHESRTCPAFSSSGTSTGKVGLKFTDTDTGWVQTFTITVID